MATVLGMCNLALARLGDSATVSSIDPPDGSPQAQHCATFYPMARDTVLDRHNWAFASRRVALNLLAAAPLSGWKYAYAAPSDAINVYSIFLPAAVDDSNPQEFEMESLDVGGDVIYTNVQGAIARYTKYVTDPSLFQPLCVETIVWLLASSLAGPLLKGDTGRQMTLACYKMFETTLGQATASDSAQRRVRPTHTPRWMGARGMVPENLQDQFLAR